MRQGQDCREASIADLVFLVDGSWSIGLKNFKTIQDFLYTLVDSFDVGEDKVRIGLILYSDAPHNEFFLNTFWHKNDILERIQALRYKGGGTNTGRSLKFMLDHQFSEKAGSRHDEGVPQIAIVITDGQAQDNFREPAEEVKNAGIMIYAVGIKDAVFSELQEIASDPDEMHVYSVEEFAGLQGISQNILQVICTTVEEVSRQITQVSPVCRKATLADIVFLVDSSASIGLENFQKVKNFLYTLVSSLHVSQDQIRIGLAQYSDDIFMEFFLNQYSLKNDILEQIQNLPFRRGSTYTGAALNSIMEGYFIESAGSRAQENTPQILILLTDGESNDDVKVPASKLRARGISLYVVGIGVQDTTELKEIASRPFNKFLFNTDNFDILEELTSSLLQTVCFAVESQIKVCSSASVADIVFLVDESSRIGQRNFHLIRTFLLKVISALDIGLDNVRVALVLYSDKPRLEFSLDTFEKKPEVLNYLTKLPYRGGQTYTGVAIDFVREKVFSKKMGSRKGQGVQQLAVVITDGESLDNFTGPASKLRRKGVTVYAVGIQNVSASGQLYKIASHPPRKHVTNLRSFLQLSNIEWIIKKRLCNEIVVQTFAVPARSRIVKEGCEETEEADIYFLIDGSGSIYPDDFHDMKVFMNELINMFQVGTDRVRFGVVQYGSTPQTEFEIHQYNTVAQLKDAIKAIQQLGGGTRTGDALKYMQDLFKSSVRDQVPQFLIIITDGKSQDDVTKAAEELRAAGIVIYAIGVKSAVQSELEDIAGTKDRMFFVNDFDSLDLIKHDVVRDICSPEACKNLKADIILLIDTSKTMDQAQFELTKQFIELIVNKSDIGAEKVQIGLLQFSSDPQEEFPLNRYDNKADLRKAISVMRQMKKGRKLGKALDFASPYFDVSKGGRPGVKQYLIVVTDGKSEDEVRNPARHLRNKGVTIYAIGVLQASNSQLLEIAGTQEKVFSEDFFDALLFLEKPILFEICNPEEDCNIDISVGLDISEQVGSPSAFHLKQKMQTYLPWLMQQMAPMINISCSLASSIRFRYQVFSRNGQSLFDSDFEPYNDEIIQKFLAVQTMVDTYLNIDFLQSFWDQSLSLTSAKVKVLLVFTDGPDDSVEMLKTTLDVIRRKGLDSFLMIGLENFQEFHELQEIEFGRGFGYREPLHIGNPELPSMLWRAFDTITERECCNVCCKCYGEDGIRGVLGLAGRKGSVGYPGSPGHPGEEGGIGDQGPVGIRGIQGNRGCSGARGPKGERGSPGSLGPRGRSGRRGVPGIDSNVFGSPGPKGNTGRQGEPGVDGVEGEPGEDGPIGPDGHRGPSGLKGAQGEEGEPGGPGDAGRKGPQGAPGRPGVPGLPGPQGLPGPTGVPGIDGVPGSGGKLGHTGQKGEHGDPGAKGLSGPFGPRGLPGQDGNHGYGLQGRKGEKGQAGFYGNPGPQGEDGDLGIPGDKGAKGTRGQRASSGIPGETGNRGSRGPPGRMGSKGQKGITAMTPCELVNLTRGNCPCCIGMSRCPVYPSEVVFALDMSADVTPESFGRMKDIMTSLLKVMKISTSNCPTGARVAVLSYNTHPKYLIRFSDFQRDNLLMEAVQRIPLERSSGQRNIGSIMRFVARNVFKRHRQGVLMRKIAIFLTAGPSQDATSINTAVLEFSALDIMPVVIALSEVPNVRQAFLADYTNHFQLYVWESKEEENLNSVSHCALCYDKCNPAPECEMTAHFPILIDMDITYIMDSSSNVGSEEFETMKEFVSNMVDHFVITSLPIESDGGARVALVQQAPRNFTVDRFSSPVHVEFDLTTYNSKDLVKMHIQESINQLEGPSAVGHALEWTVNNVFLEAPNPRKDRVIVTLLGSKTSSWDREKLRKMSLEAKCQGFTMFTLALGSGADDTEMTELSSVPVEQHLLQLGRVNKPELPYALKFSRAFLNLLKRRINPYPPPGLQEECESLDRGDTYQQLTARTDSIPFPELEYRDASLPSELPRINFQDEIMEANKQHVEHKEEEHDHNKNDYYRNISIQGGRRKQDQRRSEQVQRVADACNGEMDNGECEDYILKWYFDNNLAKCSRFWYGGCGGNQNRFDSRAECEALCTKVS
nr:collagen alpha-4(VI) chain-like [Anolis sagrei ordinatus]